MTFTTEYNVLADGSELLQSGYEFFESSGRVQTQRIGSTMSSIHQ